SNITVRSARSMQSLDRSDLLPGELAPLTLRQLAQPHGAIGDAVQPFDSETERFRNPAHNPLPTFGQRQLDLDRLALRPHARLDDVYRAAVNRDFLRARIDAHPDRRRRAVHTHAAGADQVFRLAA